MTTPVIFRKWPKSEGGGVIALFPTMVGTNDPYTCQSYEHVGQHGPAEPRGVIQITSAATPNEYTDLLEELKSIGYDDLKVIQRYRQEFLEERTSALREMDNAPAMRHGRATTRRKQRTQAKRHASSAPSGFGGMRLP